MLCSHVRMAKIEHSRVTKVFTGRVQRFDVAKTHSEILNPRNPAVAKALARCMSIIHQSAKLHRLNHGSPLHPMEAVRE